MATLELKQLRCIRKQDVTGKGRTAHQGGRHSGLERCRVEETAQSISA
jgi:hypothetical protein